MNAFDALDLFRREPVLGFRCGLVLAVELTDVVLGGGWRGYFGRRKLQDDFERCGAAQGFIDFFQALIDCGVFLEIADEAVFDFEPGYANAADHRNQQGDHDDHRAVTVRESCQMFREGQTLGVRGRRGTFNHQHHHGGDERKDHEIHDQQTHGHHPTEVDNRLNVAGGKRRKADDRGDRGVQAWPRHVVDHAAYQFELCPSGMLAE